VKQIIVFMIITRDCTWGVAVFQFLMDTI